MDNEIKLEEITFTGINVNEEVIFENKTPVVILTDILQPIVKIEKCEWLNEF